MLELLEQTNLMPFHSLLCLIGIVESIWCHSLWGRGFLGVEVSWRVNLVQRVALILYGMSQCGSLAYGYMREWQPWPPYLGAQIAVDLFMLAILLAWYEKSHRPDMRGQV